MQWAIPPQAFAEIRCSGVAPAKPCGDEPLDEKMKRLTANLKEQCAESARLDKAIWSNLKGLGYGG